MKKLWVKERWKPQETWVRGSLCGREGKDWARDIKRPDWRTGHEARWSRPSWLPGPSLSAVRPASGLQGGWVGAWAGVCVAADGERGLDWIGHPKGLPPPRSPSGWVSEVLGRSRKEAACGSHALPLPTQFRALPPAPSRSGSRARAPFSPARRQGPGPPRGAAARRPLPSPALRSPQPPAALPPGPTPRRPSVERRKTEARGEQWREQVERRRGPGPSWRRGDGLGTRLFVSQARARAARDPLLLRQVPASLPEAGTALGAGEGTRVCAHPFIWNLWQAPWPDAGGQGPEGARVGGLISSPEREQRQAWPGGKGDGDETWGPP